jgi:hypothetical protein
MGSLGPKEELDKEWSDTIVEYATYRYQKHILSCIPKMDKKASNLRVQRGKAQKALEKEIEQSKKLMGDDKPVDDIRILYEEFNDEELQAEKVHKHTALHYLNKFTELSYERSN